MRRLRSVGFIVFVLSACGGGSDGTSSETSAGGSTRASVEVVGTAETAGQPSEPDPTSVPDATNDTDDTISTSDAVTCPDDLGDVSALGSFRLDDVVVVTADMVGTTVAVSGEDLVVRWDMAPGAAAARAGGGNHQHKLLLERADGGKPYVELSVGFAGSDGSSVVSTNTEEAGLVWENDPDGAVVEVDRDSVLLSVPVALLADIGAEEWRWYAESSAGKADAGTGEQAMGQDTCGSRDAGAGSLIVTFPGPALPDVVSVDIVMPASACESVPPVVDVESVVGLTLEEPLELLGIICSFSSDDPSEFVEFSLRDAESCNTGRPYDEQGELDGVPYGLVGGRLALVEICTPDDVLVVSVNTQDGDNGPAALELMTAWLAALSA